VLFDYLLNVDARSFVACHFDVPEIHGTLRLLGVGVNPERGCLRYLYSFLHRYCN
jgi:hypothetical protein